MSSIPDGRSWLVILQLLSDADYCVMSEYLCRVSQYVLHANQPRAEENRETSLTSSGTICRDRRSYTGGVMACTCIESNGKRLSMPQKWCSRAALHVRKGRSEAGAEWTSEVSTSA